MTPIVPGASRGEPIAMFVTDRARLAPDVAEASQLLIEATVRAARAGVALIQVRERGLSDGTLCDLVREIVRGVASTPARVLVNERADVAIAAGAHGVHLPADGIATSRVRTIAPRGFLIGRSVHSRSEASLAAEDGADYAVFGTVYPTASKPAGHAVPGVGELAAVCRMMSTPVLAIGGVTPDRFTEIARAGAAGIAAIGLFVEHAPDAVMTDLRAAFASAPRGLERSTG
jgi:thiamine-phosphate diphosphorylase